MAWQTVHSTSISGSLVHGECICYKANAGCLHVCIFLNLIRAETYFSQLHRYKCMASALPTCDILHAVLCCLAITNLSAQDGDISYLQMYVPFNLISNIICCVMTLTVTVVEYLIRKTDMKDVCTSIHYIILCKPKNAMHTCIVLWIVIISFCSNLFVIIIHFCSNLFGIIFIAIICSRTHLNLQAHIITRMLRHRVQRHLKLSNRRVLRSSSLIQGHFNAKHNIIYYFNIVCKLQSHFSASVELLQLLWL